LIVYLEVQTNLLKIIISIFQEKIILSEKHLVHAILLRAALNPKLYKTTIENFVHLLLDGFSYEVNTKRSFVLNIFLCTQKEITL